MCPAPDTTARIVITVELHLILRKQVYLVQHKLRPEHTAFAPGPWADCSCSWASTPEKIVQAGMPQQSAGLDIELAERQDRLQTPFRGTTDPRLQPGWLVIPDWWAAVIPGGFDYCNVRNAPRFALLVGLVTLIIIAYQHLVSTSSETTHANCACSTF